MRITNPLAVKGEQIASDFLVKRGYTILERNFRKGYGEIDIIAVQKTQSLKKEQILVFVEVKTRQSFQFGTPLEAITPWKLKILVRTAQYFQLTHTKLPAQMRIDAIAVTFDKNNQPQVEHLQNISY